MKSFKRHIGVFEKSALAVIWLLMALAIAAQLFYGGGALTFLVALSVCAVVLSCLIFLPIRYDFEDDALVIVNPKPLGSRRIPYSDMMYYDAVGSFFALKLDFDSAEVFITYKTDKSAFKKTVSCHPQSVQDFVKCLHEKCPDISDV